MEYILASASPRRRELLKMVLPSFRVMPPQIDEGSQGMDTPENYAAALARKKACAVARLHPRDLVIGCDTVVSFKGHIYGKPENRLKEKNILETLSGNTHQVFTGVSLCLGELHWEFCQSADVRFYTLDADEIEQYILTNEWKDKAGGYAIQGCGALLVEEIRGDYFTVVGLPVAKLHREMKKFLRNLDKH